MNKNQAARPLFDTYSHLKRCTPQHPFCDDESSVKAFVQGLDALNIQASKDFSYAVQFLLLSGRKSEQTYSAFRSEVERLLLWAWLEKAKPSYSLSRHDLEEYISFWHQPAAHWVSTSRQHHFTPSVGKRHPNSSWRPFRIDEAIPAHRKTIKRTPSQSSVHRMFSILSVWFNHLLMEGACSVNHIPIVKKHSPYLYRDALVKDTHRLSETLWHYLLNTVESKAVEDSSYERNLFALVLMKSCYLRISEISSKPSWEPSMEHFYTKKGFLWLKVLGKGRKLRDISVPDDLLPYLYRYRNHRRLPSMPVPGESQPLIHKLKGQGGVSIRQATRIVQESFDMAAQRLTEEGRHEEAIEVRRATTHWLRHTGASMDIDIRPLKHLADDLGHNSLATTDKIYIQSDDIERARSGQHRKI